jgi:hypothetical protein
MLLLNLEHNAATTRLVTGTMEDVEVEGHRQTLPNRVTCHANIWLMASRRFHSSSLIPSYRVRPISPTASVGSVFVVPRARL